MRTTILTTKLTVPPLRRDWVVRPRLIDRLDQSLTHKLTLVCAPVGFGKTTLITSWLHSLEERLGHTPRLAWLALEEDDDSPLRFIAYLTAALQRLDEGIGQTVVSLLEKPRTPAINEVITLLINDLAELADESVVVLDDCHVIKDENVHGAVAFLLEHLPPHAHLIVATREEPNLPLARLRVRRQVAEIRLDDLRFTRDEASAFLDQTMGLSLNARTVEVLESRTEGWIAGLQMAALSLRGRGQKPDDLALTIDFFGGHGYIIDYLGAEVLRQQPDEMRAFLRQTSILDRFSAPLCDAVTEQQRSREFLGQLAQANLFLIPLDDQRRWFRYHALFADFLRSELTDAEQQVLHRRASAWFEAHGLTPEAIKHALAAGDVATAERLISRSVDETLSAGGFSTLLAWLNALPDDVVRARSDLSTYKAWIHYLRWEIAEAEEYAAAAAQTQRPDAPPVQRGTLLGFQCYLALTRGDPARAVELGREALTLLGDTRSFFRTTALSHLGQAQRLTGDRQAAIQTLRQAVTAGQLFGNHLITLEALGYLTALLYQQGQLREAILLCQEAASRYNDDRGNPLPMAGLALIPLGALYFEINDLDRAEQDLKTGIALSQQLGMVYYTLVGQRTLAKLLHARGATEAAWETLAAACHLAAQSKSDRRSRPLNAATAELQLREGQVDAAARTLAELVERPDTRSQYEHITMARLLHAQKHTNDAHRLLEQVERTAHAQGRLGTLIVVHVLQALNEQALNRHAAALERMRQALPLAAELGYRRSFLDEGQAIAPLLVKCRHVAADFVDDLLAALPTTTRITPRGNGSSAVAANRSLVEPLGDTQLAILRLVADGHSNQEIADKLAITLGTTKWHLNQIYGKLGVSSRTQAVAYARRVNLL